MTFEKHLRNVAAQRLRIMRKHGKVFHNRLLLLRSFRSFVLPAMEYCTALWCSATYSRIQLLDWAVRSALLIDDLQEAVLCLLFKIKSNPMNPLSRALPLLPRVTRGVLHHPWFAPPRCRTSHYRWTFALLPVSLSNDLNDHVFDGMGLACLIRAEPTPSCWPNLLFHRVFHYFVFYFLSWVGCVGRGLRIDRVSHCLPAFHFIEMLGVVSKQLSLLHGRVGDTTTSVNSEPYDETAGQLGYSSLLRWHSWAFWAH